jgi:hypothetical protein
MPTLVAMKKPSDFSRDRDFKYYLSWCVKFLAELLYRGHPQRNSSELNPTPRRMFTMPLSTEKRGEAEKKF